MSTTVVQVKDFFQTENNLYLVYEFVNYGSLNTFSEKFKKEINLKDLFVIIKKIMHACD